MRTRPGRLRRTLDRLGIPSPLVTVTGDNFTADDDQVSSVSISHGGSDPSPGVQPSTCETVIQRPLWLKTGQPLTVKLTQQAAAAIATLTGTVPTYTIVNRFAGRVGAQDYDDRADRLSARLAAASWSAQLSRVNRTQWINAGVAVSTAIRSLSTSPAVPEIEFAAFGTFDVLAADMPDATYRDTMGKLTGDIGVMLRDTRAGVLEAWALPYRMSWAEGQLGSKYPLTRSQAITPAKWSQPNENLPAKVRAEWIGSDGQPAAYSAGGTEDSIREVHDWTHIQARTDGLLMHGRSLVRQQWERVLRIPSIKVDLLYLLASDNPYHRGQAGMLLALDAGDTIGLSGDWNNDLRGIHIVSGIDEQISSEAWTITLSLIPHLLVFGYAGPAVPPMVWESATYPWDDETRNWNLEET